MAEGHRRRERTAQQTDDRADDEGEERRRHWPQEQARQRRAPVQQAAEHGQREERVEQDELRRGGVCRRRDSTCRTAGSHLRTRPHHGTPGTQSLKEIMPVGSVPLTGLQATVLETDEWTRRGRGRCDRVSQAALCSRGRSDRRVGRVFPTDSPCAVYEWFRKHSGGSTLGSSSCGLSFMEPLQMSSARSTDSQRARSVHDGPTRERQRSVSGCARVRVDSGAGGDSVGAVLETGGRAGRDRLGGSPVARRGEPVANRCGVP